MVFYYLDKLQVSLSMFPTLVLTGDDDPNFTTSSGNLFGMNSVR